MYLLYVGSVARLKFLVLPSIKMSGDICLGRKWVGDNADFVVYGNRVPEGVLDDIVEAFSIYS